MVTSQLQGCISVQGIFVQGTSLTSESICNIGFRVELQKSL